MSKRFASLLVAMANGLSLIRLIAVPVIVILIVRSAENESYRLPTFWLLVALHAGDVLDGYLARQGSRRLAERNYFGEVIDPIADKLYIGAAYLTLALTRQFHPWFAALVILRDVSIIIGWTFIFRRSGIRLLPNVLGKMTDAACAILLCTVILRMNPVFVFTFTNFTAVLILVSGLAYARMAIRSLSSA